MTPEQFTYWLQGYFELSGSNSALNEVQTQIIKDHLNLVFRKETPDRNEHTHPNFPPQPQVRRGSFPDPLGVYEECRLTSATRVPSPLGQLPDFEGSC